jgi:two-component system, OmpR family, response regulator
MTPTPSVLVLDDDPDHATLVADIARDAGYAVTSLCDPLKVTAALDKASFDVFITDLNMPGADGFEVIAQVKERDPQIAIVVMTAFGSLQTGLRALRAGAMDYLTKPFEPKELRIRIERALEGRARGLVLDRLRREGDELLRRSRGG